VSSTNSSDSASASSDAPQRPVTRSCRDSNPAVPEAVPEALTADAVRALTMQEWLDELFLPDFCEACPWMWMRGVARLLCESETCVSLAVLCPACSRSRSTCFAASLLCKWRVSCCSHSCFVTVLGSRVDAAAWCAVLLQRVVGVPPEGTARGEAAGAPGVVDGHR
jgi:hypothetical protein